MDNDQSTTAIPKRNGKFNIWVILSLLGLVLILSSFYGNFQGIPGYLPGILLFLVSILFSGRVSTKGKVLGVLAGLILTVLVAGVGLAASQNEDLQKIIKEYIAPVVFILISLFLIPTGLRIISTGFNSLYINVLTKIGFPSQMIGPSVYGQELFKSKFFGYFMLITGIVWFLIGFLWLSSSLNKSNKEASTQPQQQVQQQSTVDSNDPKQILTVLQKELSVNAPIFSQDIDWLDQNKESVPLMGQGFSLATFANDYVGKYDNYAQYPDPNSPKDITEDSLKPLQSTVDKFFMINGFQKDDQNTFRNEDLVYLNMGYAKGDLNCLITLFPQSEVFIRFFCGTIDQTQIAWRKELVPIINPKNIPNFSVRVSKLLGNYATGVAGVAPQGYVWFAVRIDGKWKEVWTGQNTISCTPVNQYNIPKEIYGNDCSTNY